MVIVAASSPLTQDLRHWLGLTLMQWTVPISAWPLGIFYRIHAHGSKILMCGQSILPDRPEASAHVMLIMLGVYALVMWAKKVRIGRWAAGFWVTLFWACLANTLRIFILAAGTAFPNLVGHVDVSIPSWHLLIDGLCILFAGVVPFLCWALRKQSLQAKTVMTHKTDIESEQVSLHWQLRPRYTLWRRVRIWLACFPVACAMALLTAQPHLSFAGDSVVPAPFSVILNTHLPHPVPITPQEQMTLSRFSTRTFRLIKGTPLFLSVQTGAFTVRFPSITQRNVHVCRWRQKSKKRYC